MLSLLLRGNAIELTERIFILSKSPKGLHMKAQGIALGIEYNNVLSSERA